MMYPLRFGIDTLEVSFAGPLDYQAKLDLGKAKYEAKQSGVPALMRIGGDDYFVQPGNRGRYSHVLRSDDLIVWTTIGTVYPQMMVKFLSDGLVAHGPESLMDRAREVGAFFGFVPLGVTRLDVALDFQGWVPTSEEMRNCVCPSNFRPVYPNADNPETFQFGKGDMVLRLYNKSREIVVNQKDWWRTIWQMCEGYDESQDVWRLEVQLRSKQLRALSCREPGRALQDFQTCFAAGLDWCSIRIPEGADSNKRRWPVHPVWKELRRAVYPKLEPVGRLDAGKTLARWDKIPGRFLSVCVSAGATLEYYDLGETVGTLTSEAKRLLEFRGTSFREAVEEKRRKAV